LWNGSGGITGFTAGYMVSDNGSGGFPEYEFVYKKRFFGNYNEYSNDFLNIREIMLFPFSFFEQGVKRK